MSGPGEEAPRANRLTGELARKRELLTSPHVRPLAEYVERMRAERGQDRVPDFDPTEAGINARLLLLLEAPGRRATRERGGSGFVSPDNDDGTAENMWWLLREAGIVRSRDVVTWNIIPWYLGSDTKIRPAEQDDLEEARPYIRELLGLVTNLRAVVLIGRRAADGWRQLAIDDIPAIEVPHPSPQNLNTRPESRNLIRDRLREAILLATESPSTAADPAIAPVTASTGLVPTALPRLRGDERFSAGATVLDFWRWALGDLRMNNARGHLAEFLVAEAVSSPSPIRVEWAPYDVLAADGTRIEVKSSAYLQSWRQKKLSTPSFGLTGAKLLWDEETGEFTEHQNGRVDAWVFALQACRDHSEYDPLNVSQWQFWVAADATVGGWGIKSTGLGFIERELGAPIPWEALHDAITKVRT